MICLIKEYATRINDTFSSVLTRKMLSKLRKLFGEPKLVIEFQPFLTNEEEPPRPIAISRFVTWYKEHGGDVIAHSPYYKLKTTVTAGKKKGTVRVVFAGVELATYTQTQIKDIINAFIDSDDDGNYPITLYKNDWWVSASEYVIVRK